MPDKRHQHACIGPNHAYYADVFRALQEGRGVQVNWAAGAGGLLWFWYRKVFVWGTPFFLSVMVLAFYIGANWLQALMAAHFASWIFGNNIYYLHTNRLIARHVRKHGEEQAIVSLAGRSPVTSLLEAVAIGMCAVSLLAGLWAWMTYLPQ